LSEKLEILENCLALPKYSHSAAAKQLNISHGCRGFDKMHEFENLNCHVPQFLCQQQPMRQHTSDAFAQK